jgi:hypothetical protein
MAAPQRIAFDEFAAAGGHDEVDLGVVVEIHLVFADLHGAHGKAVWL